MSQGSRKVGLEAVGIEGASQVHWTLSVPALYEAAVSRREGVIAANGPIVCSTGQHTGRSPNDKFIVREPSSEQHVAWGKVNRPIDADAFDGVHRRMLAYLRGKELFVQDCYAGADPAYRLPIRIITEKAWHSLFVRHMFIGEPDAAKRASPRAAVHGHRRAELHGRSRRSDKTNSEVFILLNFAKKLVLIGGTNYAGEMKKSIFTVMNYLLPLRDVMPMHCSANVGAGGDVALFFGLSGTGKTTLSSDPNRRLIGDDEHGWSSNGVFNFEGGCYAKMIRLSAEAEPQIYATTRRFGTVLENVTCDPVTRALDLNDDSVTENTRGAYPLEFIDNAIPSGHRRPSVERRHAHRRRVRRAAADRAAVAGRGDVPLPLRLHREGRRHRARRHRAQSDVQHLFRRAVHGVGSERLREAARRAHRANTRRRSGS